MHADDVVRTDFGTRVLARNIKDPGDFNDNMDLYVEAMDGFSENLSNEDSQEKRKLIDDFCTVWKFRVKHLKIAPSLDENSSMLPCPLENVHFYMFDTLFQRAKRNEDTVFIDIGAGSPYLGLMCTLSYYLGVDAKSSAKISVRCIDSNEKFARFSNACLETARRETIFTKAIDSICIENTSFGDTYVGTAKANIVNLFGILYTIEPQAREPFFKNLSRITMQGGVVFIDGVESFQFEKKLKEGGIYMCTRPQLVKALAGTGFEINSYTTKSGGGGLCTGWQAILVKRT